MPISDEPQADQPKTDAQSRTGAELGGAREGAAGVTTATPTAARKSWPIIPTIIVVICVAVMVMLGVWQLDRKGEKEALIAVYERNMANDQTVTYPELPPVEDAFLYRRSSVNCWSVTGFKPRGGSDHLGRAGIRMVAECRTGADGPGVLVDIGTADDFTLPKWDGGMVTGRIAPGPEQPSFIQQLTGKAVPSRAMLVADTPIAGLRLSAVPSAANTPNNHLMYAMQWFLFAAGAAIIYYIAARRRLRG
jgi:surfeit locus 1 family protein